MKTLVLLVVSSLALTAFQTSLDQARNLISKGDYHRAAEELSAIVAAEPGDSDAHLLMGTALALLGRRTESLQELLTAVKLKPGSAIAYNALGTALSRFAEIPSAREALETAVRLDPKFADAHVNLALVLAQQGELDAALDNLKTAVQIGGPPASMAYANFLCGKVYLQQDNFANAIESLSAATRLNPSLAQGWISLGQARRAALDDAGALAAFRRAAVLDPNNGELQDLLGSAGVANHSAHEAITHFRESLRLQPDDRATLSHLQRALRLDGQIDEAHKVEARMHELLTDRERINQTALESARLNNEGVALEQQGQLLPALEKYRAAVDLDPEHDGFRLNYGLALCRLNRWDQGIAEIREVVRRSPDNAQATRDLYIALDKQNHLNAPK